MSSHATQHTSQYIKPELQDFWKTLWHVDVKKDHSRSYDAKVVNEFLPNNGIYTTTLQTTDGKYISQQDDAATREGLEFGDLFQYLTGTPFNEIRDLAVGSTLYNVELNTALIGSNDKPVKYDIKVFTDKGGGETQLPSFITNDVCLFVDTASHLPELIANYKRIATDRAFYYTYTREIESDPADKITYESIGADNKSSYYYELPPPHENPAVITYPVFKPVAATGLSYFYCKYPIFLRYDRIRDARKYKMAVELSYKRSNGTIMTVKDGANIAGAIEKMTTGIRELFGFATDAITKEMVFISKHHGDVAQCLVKFRDINIGCPLTPTEKRNTSAYTSAFVSIDVNAIIKALTVSMPYIIMYPPDKKRIIVWKNQSLSSPIELFESQKQHVLNVNATLYADCLRYNESVDDINTQKDRFDNIVRRKLSNEFRISDTTTAEEIVIKYRELIKYGIRITVLSKYLPNQKLVPLSPLEFDFNREIEVIKVKPTDSEATIKTKKRALEKIQTRIHNKQNSFIIPADYKDFILIDDATGDIVETSLEQDILLDFEEERIDSYTISVTQAHPYDSINLGYILGATELAGRLCRITTKLNSAWGMDFLTYIYNTLEDYDEDLSELYINVLRNLFMNDAEKLKTFTYILDVNNIEVPWKLPVAINNTPQSVSGWLTSRFGAATSRLLAFVSSMFGFRKSMNSSTTAGIKRRRNLNKTRTNRKKIRGGGRVTLKRNTDELTPYKMSLVTLLSDINNHCQFIKHFLELSKQENASNKQQELLKSYCKFAYERQVDTIKTSASKKSNAFDTDAPFLLAYNVFTSYEDLLYNIESKLSKYKLQTADVQLKIDECRQLIRDIYNYEVDDTTDAITPITPIKLKTVTPVAQKTDEPITQVAQQVPGGDENMENIIVSPIKTSKEYIPIMKTPLKPKYANDIDMTPSAPPGSEAISRILPRMSPLVMTMGGKRKNKDAVKGRYHRTQKKTRKNN